MASATTWAPGLAHPAGALGPKAPSWETVATSDAGLGLRATSAIEAGEALFAVPLATCWPAAAAALDMLVAAGAEASEDELSEEALVALWLCGELDKGAGSLYAGQIAALPAELDTILQWRSEELDELRGSCFHSVALGLREETDAEWKLITSSAGWKSWLAEHPGLDGDRFQWAKAVVLSRQLELELEGQVPEGSKVVIPGFDLLNHDASGQPNCAFQVEADGDFSKTPSVIVRSEREIASREELRISYGPLPNASLLITHGFIAEDNPFNCAELFLTFPVPPQKRPWLRGIEEVAAGLAGDSILPFEVVVDGGDDAEPACEFVMRHNLTKVLPLPPTLLAAVRLQVLQACEIDSLAIRFGGVQSAVASPLGLCTSAGSLDTQSEKLAMDRLLGILRSLLSGHPTRAATDVDLLRSSEAQGRPLSRRHRMAVAVRLAEKEILAAAIKALGGAVAA